MRRLPLVLLLAACAAPPPAEAPPAEPPGPPPTSELAGPDPIAAPGQTLQLRHYSERMDVGPLIEQIARQVGWSVRVDVGVDDTITDLPDAELPPGVDPAVHAKQLIDGLVHRFGYAEERLPDGGRRFSYPHQVLVHAGGESLHDGVRLIALYAGYYPQLDPALPALELTAEPLRGDWRELLRARLLPPEVFDYHLDDDEGTLAVYPLPRPLDAQSLPWEHPTHVRLIGGRLVRDGDQTRIRSQQVGELRVEFPAGVALPGGSPPPRAALLVEEDARGELCVRAWVVEHRR